MTKPRLRNGRPSGDENRVVEGRDQRDSIDDDEDLDLDGDDGDDEGDDDSTSRRSVGKYGYPEDTPVAEMTDKEQAAYWRRRSRINEARGRKDRRDRREDSAGSDAKGGAGGGDDVAAAEKRGYERAKEESLFDRVEDNLRTRLEDRGVDEEEIEELIEATRLRGFVVDGEIDRTRIANWVTRVAPRKETRDDDRGDSDSYARRRGGLSTGQGNSGWRRRESERDAAARILQERGRIRQDAS